MQVDDPGAGQSASPAPRDEVRAVGDEPARRDGPCAGRRFRETLERGRSGSMGGDGVNDVASAAAMAAWFRPEPARPSATPAGRAATGAASVNGARAVD